MKDESVLGEVTLLISLIGAIFLVIYVLAIPALAADKPTEPLAVEPGWIFCSGPAGKYFKQCQLINMDGPTLPMQEVPK